MFTIVLDMDSTITPLPDAWFPLYNQLHGDDLTLDKVESWDVHTYCKAGRKVYEVLDTPGLFLNLKPFPHAIEVIEELSRSFSIEIATGITGKYEKEEKIAWIQRELPFLPLINVHFVPFNQNKSAIPGDVLFDDAPFNIESYPGITVALPYRYNLHTHPTKFVQNWIEFRDFICEYFGIKGRS